MFVLGNMFFFLAEVALAIDPQPASDRKAQATFQPTFSTLFKEFKARMHQGSFPIGVLGWFNQQGGYSIIQQGGFSIIIIAQARLLHLTMLPPEAP